MKPPLRTLFVEDREDDALLIEHELSSVYDVTSRRVETAAAMEAALRAQPWDVIVSDWSMPRFDGLSAFRVLQGAALDIPFIIVSGTIADDIAVDALKAGVHDYMNKGMLARLVPAVERELRDARARRVERAHELEIARQREAIERSERLLRAVVDAVPNGVVLIDGGGRIVLRNRALAHFGFELDADTLEGGRAGVDIYLPDGVTPCPREQLPGARALRGDQVDAQEICIRHPRAPDGISASVSSREVRGGELDGVVLVLHDLTPARRSEAARVRAEVAQRHAEARNSAVLASALDAIVAMDAAGVIVDFNPAAERIFGSARDRVIGRAKGDTLVPGIADHLERGVGVALAMTARRDDGGEFPAEVSLTQVEGLEPPMFTAFIRDVTERERLTAQLSERVREVEAANRELDSFAYVASHDLRAPLRDIDNLSSWIHDDAREQLTAPSLRHLDKLRDRVTRMERLLDDLLAYSRIGRVKAPSEELRAGDVIDDALGLVGATDGFEIETSGTEHALRSPRAPLVHTIRNLVHNAIKHHHRGRGRIRIDVSAGDDGWLRFSVGDDGPGIEARFHELVFRPFQTLRPRDQVEGSGLGLAIVKKMVETAGGVVEIQSAAGEGTRITFTWPRSVRVV